MKKELSCKLIISLLLIALAFNIRSMQASVTDTNTTENISNKLANKLKQTKDKKQRYKLLLDLIDLNINNKQFDIYATNLYNEAIRNGDKQLALEALKNLVNTFKIENLKLNLRRLKEIHGDQYLQILYKLNIATKEFKDLTQEERGLLIRDLNKKYRSLDKMKLSKAERLEYVGLLIKYTTGSVGFSNLYERSVEEFIKIAETLPRSEMYIRGYAYNTAANLYSKREDYKRTIYYCMKYREYMDQLENEYIKGGREYRNFDAKRYINDIRMLENYKGLSRQEIEIFYREIKELASKDKSIEFDLVNSCRAIVFYYIATENYEEAYKYLDKYMIYAKTMNANFATKLKAKIIICDKLNKKEELIDAMQKYINALEQTYQTKSEDFLMEMQMLYDVDALKSTNLKLALEKEQMKEKAKRIEVESKLKEMKNQINIQRLKEKNNNLIASRRELQIKSQSLQLKNQEEYIENRNEIIILIGSLLAMAVIFSLLIQRKNKMLSEEKKRLEVARDDAQKADRLKTMFLQNMSHEIRTPLNAIVGFNDIINGNDAGEICQEEKDKYLEIIHTNTDLLTTLINDILDFSRIESGNYKVINSVVTLESIGMAAMNSVKHRIPKNVEAIFECNEATKAIKIETDMQRLQQLLINFLTNACKYTEKGSISLSIKNIDDKELEFAVSDTGVGIPKEKANSVFNRFEKLDNFKQGTGLGLNICLSIAKILDGTVALDTSYTEGARFTFRMKLKKVYTE